MENFIQVKVLIKSWNHGLNDKFDDFETEIRIKEKNVRRFCVFYPDEPMNRNTAKNVICHAYQFLMEKIEWQHKIKYFDIEYVDGSDKKLEEFVERVFAELVLERLHYSFKHCWDE